MTMTERWLAKRDRMAFRKKGKGKKDVGGSGPQGTALPGGFGGTGSANIGRPVAQSAPSPSAATPEDSEMKDSPSATTTGSKTSTNKKKKKGRK
jgi:hypothetical protein